MSIKEKDKNNQVELIEKAKKSDSYKTMKDNFSDAELVDVIILEKDDK